jgi:hypothetical protein
LLIIYRNVIPCLQEFLHSCGKNFFNIFQHFSLPKFIYGDVTENGEGVLVLEDVSSRGFRTFDTALLLFDFDHLKVSVGGLAEFHALAIAHDLMSKQKLVKYKWCKHWKTSKQ